MYTLCVLFPSIGWRYIRIKPLADGTWLTCEPSEAKEWKTRKRVESFIRGHSLTEYTTDIIIR